MQHRQLKVSTQFALALLMTYSPILSYAQYQYTTTPDTYNVQTSPPTAITMPLSASLKQLYALNNNQAYWFGSSENEKRTKRFFKSLPYIETHGLKVSDYKFYDIIQSIETSPQATEINFSKEVLRLLKDLNVGRLDPRRVAGDVKYLPRTFKVNEVVFSFLVDPSETTIDALAPQHESYYQLRTLLARLQELNAKGGYTSTVTVPQTLKLGSVHPTIHTMKSILNVYGFNLNETEEFDVEFQDAIKELQKANLTNPTGVIKPKDADTWQFFKVSSFARQQEVEVTLEKMRWLPAQLGEKHIFLNIANQELTVTDPQLELTSPIKLQKAINGRIDRKTPSMADRVTHVVINPKWTVPPGILAKDKLPKLKSLYETGGVEAIYAYLEQQRFSLNSKMDGQPIDLYSVDWYGITAATAPFTIVQSSGYDNALGIMKFTLTNKYNIYIHDTNERGLFKLFRRLRSSGCIRIQHPVEFAAYLLQGSTWSLDKLQAEVATPDSTGAKEKYVKIAPSMSLPVYTMPITAYQKNERFYFTQDFYKQNAAVVTALKRAGYLKPVQQPTQVLNP